MEHQGKSKRQYEDSSKFTALGVVGGVLILIGLIVYNIVIHGISSY